MVRCILSILCASIFICAPLYSQQSFFSAGVVLMIAYVWVRRERRHYFYRLKVIDFASYLKADRKKYYPFMSFEKYSFPAKKKI